jgi:hypothetical protein
MPKADARREWKKKARKILIFFWPSANIRKSPETRRAVRKSFGAQNLLEPYGRAPFCAPADGPSNFWTFPKFFYARSLVCMPPFIKTHRGMLIFLDVAFLARLPSSTRVASQPAHSHLHLNLHATIHQNASGGSSTGPSTTTGPSSTTSTHPRAAAAGARACPRRPRPRPPGAGTTLGRGFRGLPTGRLAASAADLAASSRCSRACLDLRPIDI